MVGIAFLSFPAPRGAFTLYYKVYDAPSLLFVQIVITIHHEALNLAIFASQPWNQFKNWSFPVRGIELPAFQDKVNMPPGTGRVLGDDPPSKASEASMAPLTSPMGPPIVPPL